MPFTKDDYILCVDTRTQNAEQGVVKDKTPYGAPNQVRTDQANFLVVAELQEKQKLVFQDNIDNSLPLSTLQWYFNSKVNSIYRFFLFANVPYYSGSDTYKRKEVDVNALITQYPSIIYHVGSSKFYRVKDDAPSTTFSAIQPTITVNWQNYWSEISNFSEEITNTNLIIHIYDELVAFAYEDCLKDTLVDTVDKMCCGCNNLEEILPYLQAKLMLYGAKSEDWQGHSDRSDYIITKATEKFCC